MRRAPFPLLLLPWFPLAAAAGSAPVRAKPARPAAQPAGALRWLPGGRLLVVRGAGPAARASLRETGGAERALPAADGLARIVLSADGFRFAGIKPVAETGGDSAQLCHGRLDQPSPNCITAFKGRADRVPAFSADGRFIAVVWSDGKATRALRFDPAEGRALPYPELERALQVTAGMSVSALAASADGGHWAVVATDRGRPSVFVVDTLDPEAPVTAVDGPAGAALEELSWDAAGVLYVHCDRDWSGGGGAGTYRLRLAARTVERIAPAAGRVSPDGASLASLEAAANGPAVRVTPLR